MPGALTRRGPAKETGETRSDHTGSVRKVSPPAWMSIVACPTMVTRKSCSDASVSGLAWPKGLGHVFGQRFFPPPICHHTRSAKAAGGMPSGLKKMRPSKWSLAAPE